MWAKRSATRNEEVIRLCKYERSFIHQRSWLALIQSMEHQSMRTSTVRQFRSRTQKSQSVASMNRDYKKSEICNRGRKVETVDDFGQSRKNNNSKNLRCSSREIGNIRYLFYPFSVGSCDRYVWNQKRRRVEKAEACNINIIINFALERGRFQTTGCGGEEIRS